MQTSNVYEWIKKEEPRKAILMAISQPMTAQQLSKRTGLPVNSCSHVISKFASMNVAACLNPEARNSRLYGLTELGKACRNKLGQESERPVRKYHQADIDWHIYGWICFSHRGAVVRTLTRPMQPSEIKRVLRLYRPNIKISANNIRDVVKLLAVRQILRPIQIRKKAHLRYELTDLGLQLQKLLMYAEV